MQFEVSERISTRHSKEEILHSLERQLKKVAKRVERFGDSFEVRSVEASFGSINRTDITVVNVAPVEDGFLVVGAVRYSPSLWFWIIVLFSICTYIGWLLPVAFYMIQKGTVKTALADCFQRTKNEYYQNLAAVGHMPTIGAPAPLQNSGVVAISSANDLEKCPFCAELIKKEAILCRFCRSEIKRVPVVQNDSNIECPLCCEMTPASSINCVHCNSKLLLSPPDTATSRNVCTCGHNNKPNAKFCNSCGNSIVS